MPPTAIFVLGAHRSGTSAFTRVANLMGAEIGPNLMPPVASDNPRGFWEPRDVVDRHDALLEALGRSWADLRPLPPGWRQTAAGLDARRDLVAIAAERFRDAPLWILKDPRLCHLLPLWLEIADALGHRSVCVLVHRHPMEVEASLARRNAFSAGHALLLWLDHVLAAEESSRGRPRAFVTYDQILGDWSAVVARVGRELDLVWPRAASSVRSEVEGFLDPTLHHHRERSIPAGVGEELAEKTLAIFRRLEDASGGGESQDLRDALDGLRRDADALRLEQLERAIETSRVATETSRDRACRLEAALVKSAREREEEDGRTSALLATLSADLAATQATNRDLERRLAETAERFDALDRDTSAALASSHEETRRLERRLRDAAEEYDDLARRAQQMYRSSSWRLTEPLRWLYDRTASLRAFAHEARAFPTRARRTWQSRGGSALARDVAGELRRRLRHGSLGPPPPDPPAALDPVAAEVVPLQSLVLPHCELPRVSIVIPALDQFRHTAACLTSLVRHASPLAFEVILVDDGSTDETTRIEQRVQNLRVVRNPTNLGFVTSCNRGAAVARGESLVFLNNDCQVTPGWLDALIETLDSSPDVGLVGAKLIYPDGRLQEAGGIVFRDGSAWNYGRHDDPRDGRYNFVRDVDYCSGACIALRRETFAALGGFDARYAPAYFEDCDLAFAIRAGGQRVVYQPRAEVIHFEGATSGLSTTSGAKRFQEINRRTFARKWRGALAEQRDPRASPDSAAYRGRGGHVLVLDAYTPRPDRDAGSARMVRILKLLRRLGWRVTFLPANLAYFDADTRALQAAGIETLYHPFVASLEEHLQSFGWRYGAVLVSRLEVARTAIPVLRRHCPNARIVFDTVDLSFLRERRAAAFRGENGGSVDRVKEDELAAARAADLTLVVSTAEAEVLAAEAPDVAVELLSLIEDGAATTSPFAERSGILFLCSFAHPPNVDALEHYLRDVAPLVAARLPEARLTVIGADPPSALTRLASQTVSFAGHVPDVRPFFETARLSVAPLRYGAGIKGKVLTSLRLGVPMVLTRIAAEGIGLEDGHDALVADDPRAFADAIVALHSNAELWQSLSANGRSHVLDRFSEKGAEAALRRILPEPPGSLP